jgi:hypothetical protein
MKPWLFPPSKAHRTRQSIPQNQTSSRDSNSSSLEEEEVISLKGWKLLNVTDPRFYMKCLAGKHINSLSGDEGITPCRNGRNGKSDWWLVSSAIFLKKIGSGTPTDTTFGRRSVNYIDARKNVPERRSGLRPSKKELPIRRFVLSPSEKELPGRRSEAFRHKNTPAGNVELALMNCVKSERICLTPLRSHTLLNQDNGESDGGAMCRLAYW